MKKIISLALTLIMCMTFCVPAFAVESASEEQPFFAMDRETTDLAVYQAAMAEYVESQRNVLLAEVATYQGTNPTVRSASYYYGGFYYQPGDILVTSDTFADGLVGHAGMVLQSSSGTFRILEITPNTYNGANARVTSVSFAMWFGEYSNTYVLRSNYSGYGENAAIYGNSVYVNGSGSNITYFLNPNLYGTGNTYCSALVWRCFYYGAGQGFTVTGTGPVGGIQVVPPMYLPYDFITFRSYNGLSGVHSVNW